MKALILAGGKGTRLGEKTLLTPKPMLEIGGKPVLLHQIELLKKYKITDITLLVNHLSQSIVDYFGNGDKFGVKLSYFHEKNPLGTAGGLKDLESDLGKDFLLLYGDVMVNMDLSRLISFHRSKNSDCTLVVHPNDHPYDSDLLDIDENSRVKAFHAKPHSEGKYYRNLVNAGLYVLSPSIFDFLKKGKKVDFGKDVFPDIFKKINMFGYNTSEYLKDMGTPMRLEKVTKDYLSGRIERSNYEHPQSCIFLDRDGVLNEDLNLISQPEDLHLFEYTAEAINEINHSEYLAIVATNQSVVARNLCTIEELNIIHNKIETDLGISGAYLNALYYCPHHPDKGYPEENKAYKIDCDCRKPKPGMLLQAAKDYNLNLSKSWFIGDSESDIKAGKTAGCKTIAVRSGRSKGYFKTQPDFWFENLKEATSFIVNDPYSNLLKKVDAELSKHDKTPVVIAIGGRARSGKSNICSYIALNFESKGKKVLRVELDNWLLAESDRVNAKNVFDRFQLPLLTNDLVRIIEGKKTVAPGYSNNPEVEKESVVYFPAGYDVIIIDGVVALSMPEVRKLSQLKIFVNIESSVHKERVFDYYRWRGKTENEIHCLYYTRLLDEYRLIDRHVDFADLVV
ncbi:MAG: HAD-IIIA family hydrolase [Tenuifilaceae bacterium]